MGSRRRVLVTGFGPFDERAVNTSAAVLEHLPPQVGDCEIITQILPVSWAETPKALQGALTRTSPVIAVGLGMSRNPWVALERIAVNFRALDRLDGTGSRAPHERISDDGPLAYRSDLRLESLQRRLEVAGVPVRISGSAGDYLCNAVFYLLMRARTSGVPRRAGFVHLPPLPDDSGLPLKQSIQAVNTILDLVCADAVSERG